MFGLTGDGDCSELRPLALDRDRFAVGDQACQMDSYRLMGSGNSLLARAALSEAARQGRHLDGIAAAVSGIEPIGPNAALTSVWVWVEHDGVGVIGHGWLDPLRADSAGPRLSVQPVSG